MSDLVVGGTELFCSVPTGARARALLAMSQPARSAPRLVSIGNYKLGKVIGRGSFGQVRIAEHELTGHHVAVKVGFVVPASCVLGAAS
jgi:serine/threonine protein kinase